MNGSNFQAGRQAQRCRSLTALLKQARYSRRRRFHNEPTIDRVVERLEQRTLLSAVAAPTIHLKPEADTGRSNSDNIVNSLTTSDFAISGGSVQGLNPSHIRVITEPTLLEDGSNSPTFSEGRHAFTAQMIVQWTMDVAGTGGGLEPNITFPAQFIETSDVLLVTIDETAPEAPTIAIDPASNAGLPDPFVERVSRDNLLSFQGVAEADAIVRLFVDGEFDGLTLAVPWNGNEAFPDGLWDLTGTLDLNDPDFFPLDGLRQITATAEDRAGNVSEEGTLNIFVDTQGPQITAVDINEQNNAYDLFNPKPSTDGATPPVSSLVISVQDLPLRSDEDPNFLYDALWEPIAENPGHYALVGDHHGVIPINSVDFETVDDQGTPIAMPEDGEPAFGRITLAFEEFLPDDRYTLTLSDSLVDPAGNPLDGESNATEPLEAPAFPSGDGQPGGGFMSRFTIDSRPEIGVVGQRSIGVDINGNLAFDPNGLTDVDAVNRDFAFDFGIQTDAVFAGQFNTDMASDNDNFDRLGAYGLLNGKYRWLLDFDNDGVPDNSPADDSNAGTESLLQLNAVPFAGDFDANHPGDEIGFFTGRTWYFDTDGDNNIGPEGNINNGTGDTSIAGDMQGRPIIGDFDGDGLDDLGTHLASQSANRFYFDLTSADDGTPGVLDGSADDTIAFGFPGVLEKPFSNDFNLDGIDDLGLMVPNQEGNTPGDTAEWYFLISDAMAARDGTVDALDHPFSPDPLGDDLFAQFGSNLGLPLVGNFDPPVTDTEPAQGDVAVNAHAAPAAAALMSKDSSRNGAGDDVEDVRDEKTADDGSDDLRRSAKDSETALTDDFQPAAGSIADLSHAEDTGSDESGSLVDTARANVLANSEDVLDVSADEGDSADEAAAEKADQAVDTVSESTLEIDDAFAVEFDLLEEAIIANSEPVQGDRT